MLSQVPLDQGQGFYLPSGSPRMSTYAGHDGASLAEVMSLLRYQPKTQPVHMETQYRRRRVRAGQSLYTMQQEFNGFYVVRMGAFKSVIRDEGGEEHVISFSTRGDLLGTDGVSLDHFQCEAVALTASEVIRVPSDGIFSNHRPSDDVEKMLYWAISRELSRELAAYALAHSSKSEVRVARFLLTQSERFAEGGWSARRFRLTMSRREIGSYLNVTLETVSRAFSRLHQLGIIEIAMREVTICSPQALRSFEG